MPENPNKDAYDTAYCRCRARGVSGHASIIPASGAAPRSRVVPLQLASEAATPGALTTSA